MQRAPFHPSKRKMEMSIRQVLVVDDSKTCRFLVCEVLKSFGISTDQAVDGQEAIEYLKAHTYDAVLLDYEMPTLRGDGVVKWIYQKLRHKPLILMISSHDEIGFSDEMMRLGCDCVLTKPIKPRELFKTLNQFDPSKLEL